MKPFYFILAGIAGVFFLAKTKKQGVTKTGQVPDLVPEPVQPPQAPNQNAQVIDPDINPEIVISRVRQLARNREEVTAAIDMMELNPYERTTYPAGLSAVVRSTTGEIPYFPAGLNMRLNEKLKQYKPIEFEKRKNAIGFDAAMAELRQKLNFGEINLFPGNISDLIEQRLFGKPGKADKDRSERINDFDKDIAIFCNNLAVENQKIYEYLFDRAANQLAGAGWKVIGYNA